MANILTTTYPYTVAAGLKGLCDEAQGAMDIVAERIDDHFLQAELIQFAHQYRQISIDLRKAMLRLDAPEILLEQRRATPRNWDTALSNRDRFAMLLEVEARTKAMLEALRTALCETLPPSLEETIHNHYLEVKHMQRQLRVMREMVNPY